MRYGMQFTGYGSNSVWLNTEILAQKLDIYEVKYIQYL